MAKENFLPVNVPLETLYRDKANFDNIRDTSLPQAGISMDTSIFFRRRNNNHRSSEARYQSTEVDDRETIVKKNFMPCLLKEKETVPFTN